jgi:DNA polymerase-3 subunit gamma/tau
VVTALYRRYRPETFAELIGQSQVTDPLRTALRTDRVNHAYLFSGPRGCGKTTSARILARCLNCAQGPTDTPCGVCPSCVELSRDGGGSLDVVEIDAASHGGVDDARDLRERAIFAPARDRYKIFILDEAHMVTSTGFNALLKIVEEPPEHVKFIFATTEPEKVIGTIRSRTHHYPFRLVPPAQMLEYVQQLCDAEKVTVEPGVLSLVVRAGGGSVRDTLSLLDQLISGSDASNGSDGTVVAYERAVALLGYTHGTLLNEAVEAFGQRDNGAVFAAVDRVIQTGQDPRRFVEDLLERLRDLIIVAATADHAAAVLRGIPSDELVRMAAQAATFGQAELSRTADIVNAALTEMTGATSPRLHLELMAARILIPASDDSNRGALARVERLERRVGVDTGAAGVASDSSSSPRPVSAPSRPPERPAVSSAPVARPATPARPESTAPVRSQPAPAQSAPVQSAPSRAASPVAAQPVERVIDPEHPNAAATAPVPPIAATGSWPAVAVPGAPRAATPPVAATPSAASPDVASSSDVAASPETADSAVDADAAVETLESVASVSTNAPSAAAVHAPSETAGPSADEKSAASVPPVEEPPVGQAPPVGAKPVEEKPTTADAPTAVTLQQMKDTWPEVLDLVQKTSMNAWTVVFNAQVRALDGDILVLVFSNQTDQAKFKELTPAGEGVSAILRSAIIDVLGLRVKFIAQVNVAPTATQPRPAAAPASATPPPADDEAPEPTEPDVEPSGWAVAAIPPSPPTQEELDAQRAAARKPAAKVVPVPTAADSRYGEAVVREILNANFVEEQPVTARVVPKDF